MRGWLAFSLLLILLLAGCSSKTPGGSPAGTTDPASVPPSAAAPGHGTPATTTTGPAPTSGPSTPPSQGGNHPPIPDVKPSVKNGPAPLLVNFTLSATDADGDALAWTFDANSDGTNEAAGGPLPKTVTYAYSQAGTSNATFRVTDGKQESVFTVIVTIVSSKPDPVVFKGHVDVIDPVATATGVECVLDLAISAGGPGDVVGNIHDLPDVLDGWHYSFDKQGFLAEFWSAAPGITGVGSSGEVPADSVQVWVCGKDPSALNADYTLTITPP